MKKNEFELWWESWLAVQKYDFNPKYSAIAAWKASRVNFLDLLAAAIAVRDGWEHNLTEPMAVLNATIDKCCSV